MPSIEMKSIDRLGVNDRLFVDAGILAKAGRSLDDKLIRLLGTHKVAVIPVIQPTHEERRRIETAGMDEGKFILEVIDKQSNRLLRTRATLVEQLRSVYIPFSETDRSFCARGKKKQLTEDLLLSPDPGPLYQDDIDAGSQAILTGVILGNLKNGLESIYEYLEEILPAEDETSPSSMKLLPAGLPSIRLHSIYASGRLQTAGDALVWHAVDTAIIFLLATIRLNRRRILAGAEPSTKRFNPEDPSFQKVSYYYERELIAAAALGILIHALGFCHSRIHEILSSKPVITGESSREMEIVKTLRRNYNVTRNLLRNRDDISPISRMMVTGQYDYPDGTGYPPTDRNTYLHEFLRLFHIIDTWDELTNPVLARLPFGRHETLSYLKQSSGAYTYRRDSKVYCPKFDDYLVRLLEEVLRPYSPGEKVYIYPKENGTGHVYVGRVFAGGDSPIPLISILKDERTGRNHPFGKVILDISKSAIYIRNQGKSPAVTKNAWLSGLIIREGQLQGPDFSGYEDRLYGAIRSQPRKR